MIDEPTSSQEFFYADGTMRPDTPSYVPRPADAELFEYVSAGKLSYVLTSRQMGKSSLMIRTAAKLEEAGVKTAIVDLSAIGTEITAHQWYLDVALSISEELNLSVDLLNWWQTQIASGSVKCFSNFLRDVVLQEIQSNVVVFIDEIDTTLNLNFADDFFAAIRAIYNARAREPIFNRLTFVLIGVATPSDLIQDEKRTPFNVGQPIALKDFTHSDAQVLQDGLKQIYSEQAEQIFDRVFYWTAGHPYLTQKLCIAITEDTKTSWEPSDVDLLVNRLFLSSKAAEKEDNLQFVQKNVTINSRTRSLLQLYEKVLTGQPPQNDDHDLLQNQLKLIGLVQSDQGVLGIRNQIYQHVFNDKWISENMPPPGWVRPVTITAPLVALALIIFFAPIYLNIPTPWNPVTQTVDTALIQAQTLEDSFLNTTSADVQMTNLAELIALGFSDKAEELFFEDLSLAEQIALFENVNIQAVGQERVTDVIDLIYSSEQASANIQVTILAKLFESEGLEEKANALLFDELSSNEQLDLFRDATSEIVSPKIIVIFKAIAHSAGSNIRIAALATLFQSNGYTVRTREMFFNELTFEEQIVLFQTADLQIVDRELFVVANAIYPQANNTQNNNRLLATIVQTFEDTNQTGPKGLVSMIQQWLAGREAYSNGEYEAALEAYNSVIKFDDNNSEAYFDRALTFVEQQDFLDALDDFNTTLQLNRDKTFAISSIIYGNPTLHNVWESQINEYQFLQTSINTLASSSHVAIQALKDTVNTTLVMSFYDRSGTLLCSNNYILEKGGSALVSVNDLESCPAGFNGHGIISSDQPISSVDTLDTILSSGDLQNLKRAASEALNSSGSQLFLPSASLEPDNFQYWTVSVLNTGTSMGEVEIHLLNRDGELFAKRTLVLGPSSSTFFILSSIQDTFSDPDGWNGAIQLIADNVFITGQTISCSKVFCVSYNGMISGSNHWFVPIHSSENASSNDNSFSTITVMNTSPTELSQIVVSSNQNSEEKEYALAPLGSIEINVDDEFNLLTDNTIEIVADGGKVVVNAQYLNFIDNQGAAYNGLAVGQGSSQLFFPDLSWASDRNSDSTIYLQNLSNFDVDPTILLYEHVNSAEGNTVTPIEVQLEPLAAYQTLAIDVKELLGDQVDDLWEGSAVIKGAAEMGAVILIRSDGVEQWATAYNAIPEY